MKLLLSGASGMVGSTLAAAWRSQGHDVWTLVRNSARTGIGTIFWAPQVGPDPSAMEGFDAMIHLAGEPIAKGRWTPARKAAIRSSRVDTTRLLAQTFSQMARPPKTWICASAIGYYGDRGNSSVTEADLPGQGFLAQTCVDWEAAATPALKLNIRVIHLRIGVVLSLQGGALPVMKRPFDWGLGGPMGDGMQYMSWITLEDLCGIIRHVLRDEALRGPVNAVSPNPVTNNYFSEQLAAALHRPALIRLPQRVARMALGEMADALLYASTRVKPAILEAKNYRFLFPDLPAALQHLLR